MFHKFVLETGGTVAHWYVICLSRQDLEVPGSNLNKYLKFIELEMLRNFWDSKYNDSLMVTNGTNFIG